MAGRGLDSSLVTQSESAGFYFLFFVKLELNSGTKYLHNGIGEFPFGGNTYEGLGDVGGIEPIEDGVELSPYAVTLTLSGIDELDKESANDFMDQAINENYFGRPASIYIGALNYAAGTLVVNPGLIWSGYIDSAEVNAGEEKVVKLTCESEMALFDKPGHRMNSDADQQDEYPGDLFFEFLPRMVDVTIKWGEKIAQYGSSGGLRTITPKRGALHLQ